MVKATPLSALQLAQDANSLPWWSLGLGVGTVTVVSLASGESELAAMSIPLGVIALVVGVRWVSLFFALAQELDGAGRSLAFKREQPKLELESAAGGGGE